MKPLNNEPLSKKTLASDLDCFNNSGIVGAGFFPYHLPKVTALKNIIEYKDWLFVKVPDYDYELLLDLQPKEDWYKLDFLRNTDRHLDSVGVTLPPGSWQIIGKGDAIDWDGVVGIGLRFEAGRIVKGESNTWPNYLYPYSSGPEGDCRTATESGHSLLKSLGMEPGTTLVLKKNEK